jgi:pyridoxine 5-phosphate synthase
MADARALGADRVELYTEPYAAAWGRPDQDAQLARYVATAQAATAVGLGLNAGHDLNQDNLPAFVQALPQLLEVSIGHAFMADALEWGYAATVAAYLKTLEPRA